MEDMMRVKDAAKLWGITERRVIALCQADKIKGAIKNGRAWEIPCNTKKPADSRIKTGAYVQAPHPTNLPLPIGVSEYRLASTEYYYVDKTMMIKDFLDERPIVSLFTRPRRFGKTLTMDMFRTFFEKSDEDTARYFKNKKIWSYGEKYQSYQGKFPVIFLTFKDIQSVTWDETYAALTHVIRSEFLRHSDLANSTLLTDPSYYQRILQSTASRVDYEAALLQLSQMLHVHHGVAPILIIDEYDTPIQSGQTYGFCDEVLCFLRNLLTGGLKDNKHLTFGFLTGVLRADKVGLFSSLNNLAVNSILDGKYSEYFGFTLNEVQDMARYYNAEDKLTEICEWYDGYKFGNTTLFNPWSVINYFRNDCQPRAYWQSTGSNNLIGKILDEADETVWEKLNALLQGKSFLTYIDTGILYPQFQSNPSSVYSFLLVSGYLKTLKSESSFNGDYMCEVALPNKELSYVYSKEILQKLNPIVPLATAISIQEALYSHNTLALQAHLGTLLMQSVSSCTTVGEKFFHGLVLGLCATLSNRYSLLSDYDSVKGRYAIYLCPTETTLPGILIELKATRNCSDEELKRLSDKVLEQMNGRKFETDLLAQGVKSIFKYGVAFNGKSVKMSTSKR